MCKRILIVDDDEWVLFVLYHTLMTLGNEYEVSTARDGEQAAKEIHQDHYDLVITDLNMPAIDGVELTRIVRQDSPNTIVVWITAFGSASFSPEAEALQVFRCVEKPLEVSEIRQVALQALESAPIGRTMAVSQAD